MAATENNNVWPKLSLTTLLIVMLSACTAEKESTCLDLPITPTTISTAERTKINKLEQDNELVVGCVTQTINELSNALFTDPEVAKANSCKTDINRHLTYEQWVDIYESCMVITPNGVTPSKYALQ